MHDRLSLGDWPIVGSRNRLAAEAGVGRILPGRGDGEPASFGPSDRWTAFLIVVMRHMDPPPLVTGEQLTMRDNFTGVNQCIITS